MGSHFGKAHYKILKPQENGKGVAVFNESNSGESDESRAKASKVSTWKAIVNITSFVQGVGTLALPYAVLKGGIATVISFPLFALIHWYTGKIMVDCLYDDKEKEISEYDTLQPDTDKETKESKKLRIRNSYSELGKVLWPQYGSTFLDVLQNVDLSTLGVSYLISCGSLMEHAIPNVGLTQAMWASIIAAVVLPSTFVKDLACVAWQSIVSVASLTILVSVLVWFTFSHPLEINLKHFLFWDTEGALVAFGLVISSYCVYSILIPVEESMVDPSRFGSALGSSLLLAAIFKLTFSLCGFLAFSRNTDEVIGNNFPPGAARTMVSVAYVTYVIFSYTLTIYPVFQSLDESRMARIVSSFIPSFIWTVTTRFLAVFATLLIAVAIPHFALLTAFVGSLALPFLEYILPCLVHLKLNWLHLKPFQIAADVVVIITGLLGTVFGVYFSGKALVVEMSN